ncbi:MAG: ribosomal L7Ae/L30e/S12e/Gadd45 family protein [Oscillospiraceae bacterium]
MSDDRLLSSLALCRKAGALTIGYDASIKALSGRKAVAVVVANDAAERTRRNIERECEGKKVELIYINRTQCEIEAATGRKFALAVVCDDKLALLVKRNAAQDKETKV